MLANQLNDVVGNVFKEHDNLAKSMSESMRAVYERQISAMQHLIAQQKDELFAAQERRHRRAIHSASCRQKLETSEEAVAILRRQLAIERQSKVQSTASAQDGDPGTQGEGTNSPPHPLL